MQLRRENQVKVIHKAAAVIDCFAQKRDWSLTELTESLGWHTATLHRILSTLESIGYLQQDPLTRRYRLGLKLMNLGARVMDELDLPKLARPLMQELSSRCGETVYLAALQGCEVLYLEVAQAERPVRITAATGERRPAHSAGTGKVLLAHAPPDVVAACVSRRLERFTPRTLVVPEELEREFASIRARGYATSYQEHDDDVSSVAAPVRDATGNVTAALSISGPAFRLPPEALHELAPTLLDTARRLSTALGAPPDRS